LENVRRRRLKKQKNSGANNNNEDDELVELPARRKVFGALHGFEYWGPPLPHYRKTDHDEIISDQSAKKSKILRNENNNNESSDSSSSSEFSSSGDDLYYSSSSSSSSSDDDEVCRDYDYFNSDVESLSEHGASDDSDEHVENSPTFEQNSAPSARSSGSSSSSASVAAGEINSLDVAVDADLLHAQKRERRRLARRRRDERRRRRHRGDIVQVGHCDVSGVSKFFDGLFFYDASFNRIPFDPHVLASTRNGLDELLGIANPTESAVVLVSASAMPLSDSSAMRLPKTLVAQFTELSKASRAAAAAAGGHSESANDSDTDSGGSDEDGALDAHSMSMSLTALGSGNPLSAALASSPPSSSPAASMAASSRRRVAKSRRRGMKMATRTPSGSNPLGGSAGSNRRRTGKRRNTTISKPAYHFAAAMATSTDLLCLLMEAGDRLPDPAAFDSMFEYEQQLIQWGAMTEDMLQFVAMPDLTGRVLYRPALFAARPDDESLATDFDTSELDSSEGSISSAPSPARAPGGGGRQSPKEGDDGSFSLLGGSPTGGAAAAAVANSNSAASSYDGPYQRAQLDRDPWDALLVPPQPSPHAFDTFEAYELAMQRWACACYDCVETMPPHARQLHEMLPFVDPTQRQDNLSRRRAQRDDEIEEEIVPRLRYAHGVFRFFPLFEQPTDSMHLSLPERAALLMTRRARMRPEQADPWLYFGGYELTRYEPAEPPAGGGGDDDDEKGDTDDKDDDGGDKDGDGEDVKSKRKRERRRKRRERERRRRAKRGGGSGVGGSTLLLKAAAASSSSATAMTVSARKATGSALHRWRELDDTVQQRVKLMLTELMMLLGDKKRSLPLCVVRPKVTHIDEQQRVLHYQPATPLVRSDLQVFARRQPYGRRPSVAVKDRVEYAVPDYDVHGVDLERLAVEREYGTSLCSIVTSMHYIDARQHCYSWFYAQRVPEERDAEIARVIDQLEVQKIRVSELINALVMSKLYVDEFAELLKLSTRRGGQTYSNVVFRVLTADYNGVPLVLMALDRINDPVYRLKIAHLIDLVLRSPQGASAISHMLEMRDIHSLSLMAHAASQRLPMPVDVFPYEALARHTPLLVPDAAKHQSLKAFFRLVYMRYALQTIIHATLKQDPSKYRSLKQFLPAAQKAVLSEIASALEANTALAWNVLFAGLAHRASSVSHFALFIVVQLLHASSPRIQTHIRMPAVAFLDRVRRLSFSPLSHTRNAVHMLFSVLRGDRFVDFLHQFYANSANLLADLSLSRPSAVPTRRRPSIRVAAAGTASSSSAASSSSSSPLQRQQQQQQQSSITLLSDVMLDLTTELLEHGSLESIALVLPASLVRKLLDEMLKRISNVAEKPTIERYALLLARMSRAYHRIALLRESAEKSGREFMPRGPSRDRLTLQMTHRDAGQLVNFVANIGSKEPRDYRIKAHALVALRHIIKRHELGASIATDESFYAKLLVFCKDASDAEFIRQSWCLFFQLVQYHADALTFLRKSNLLHSFLNIVGFGADQNVIVSGLHYVGKLLRLVEIEQRKMNASCLCSRREKTLKSIEQDVKSLCAFIAKSRLFVRIHMLARNMLSADCPGRAFQKLAMVYSTIASSPHCKPLAKEMLKNADYKQTLQRITCMFHSSASSLPDGLGGSPSLSDHALDDCGGADSSLSGSPSMSSSSPPSISMGLSGESSAAQHGHGGAASQLASASTAASSSSSSALPSATHFDSLSSSQSLSSSLGGSSSPSGSSSSSSGGGDTPSRSRSRSGAAKKIWKRTLKRTKSKKSNKDKD
jgi:hypothetical protein